MAFCCAYGLCGMYPWHPILLCFSAGEYYKHGSMPIHYIGMEYSVCFRYWHYLACPMYLFFVIYFRYWDDAKDTSSTSSLIVYLLLLRGLEFIDHFLVTLNIALVSCSFLLETLCLTNLCNIIHLTVIVFIIK